MCGFVTSRTGGDGTSKTPSRCTDGGESDAGAPTAKANIANSYQMGGRFEDALRIYRDVYSKRLKLKGEEHGDTCKAAYNYVTVLATLKRFDETKAIMLRMIPVARRTLGESNDLTLSMRGIYAEALYEDPSATLGDLREAVETLEETERIAQRVLGGANPRVRSMVQALRAARATLLNARESLST